MRHIPLAVAAALLFPMAGSTCPTIEAPMSFVVGISAYIARVRIASVHEVAGTVVARVAVVEEFKGPLGVPTMYAPLEFVQRPDGETPGAGDTGLLFAGPGANFRGTRQFWLDVDALREDAPLIEGAILYWLPFVEGRLAVPVEIVLAPGSEEGGAEAQREESGWRLTSSQGFMLALAEAVAEEASAVVP